MNTSEFSIREQLSRPAVIVAVGLVLFLAQLSQVFNVVDTIGPYNFRGMWITIPDFDQRLNDPQSAAERVFTRLNGWDGQWYYHIAANGYQCTAIPESNNPHVCNVSFFPLVPALGAALAGLGIDLVYALPLVSQLAWLATIVLVLFFIRSIAPIRPLHLLALLALVTYPGAVYGFVSYSEAVLTLLIVTVTAVTYWYLHQPRALLLWILAIACLLMTLAKISGAIALGLPVLMALLHPAAGGRFFTRRQLLVYAASAAGVLGIVAFLVYCEIRFGDWALYFRYVGSGWGGSGSGGVNLNPLNLFATFTWHEYIPLRTSNLIVVTLPVVILVLALAMVRDRKSVGALQLAIIATVVALYYFYGTLGNSSHFQNFNIARHMLPVVALIVTLAMLLLGRVEGRAVQLAWAGVLVGLVAVQYYLQIQMLVAFKIGNWVS